MSKKSYSLRCKKRVRERRKKQIMYTRVRRSRQILCQGGQVNRNPGTLLLQAKSKGLGRKIIALARLVEKIRKIGRGSRG